MTDPNPAVPPAAPPAVPPAASPVQPRPVAPPAPKKRETPRWLVPLLAGLTALFLILTIVFAILYFTKPTTTTYGGRGQFPMGNYTPGQYPSGFPSGMNSRFPNGRPTGVPSGVPTDGTTSAPSATSTGQ